MRLSLSLLTVLIMAVAGAAPTPAHAAAGVCDRYASPSGSDRATGVQSQPYRTAQRLADSLEPGQTGCLTAGSYQQEVDGPFVLNIRHGGRRGAPITIRSVPGQRARLRGIIYIWKQSSYVTISDLDIDARRPRADRTTGVQINARHTIFERNTVTNRGKGICSVLGVRGWGRAVGTVVRLNTFYDCGWTRDQNDHSLYIEYADRVRVVDNLFLRSGSYAVHFYPEARRSIVRRNVMIDNGGGVIFAGTGRHASRGNLVERNIIVGSYRMPGIHSWWGGPVGSGNVARDNCLSNRHGDIDRSGGGFSASSNVVAEPRFRNPAAGDYRLAEGSPCQSVIGRDPVGSLEREHVLAGIASALSSR